MCGSADQVEMPNRLFCLLLPPPPFFRFCLAVILIFVCCFYPPEQDLLTRLQAAEEGQKRLAAEVAELEVVFTGFCWLPFLLCPPPPLLFSSPFLY